MRNKYLYITLLAILGFNSESWAQYVQSKGAPRLVVSITIDQLRSDYLEAFAPLYSDKGFKRLLDGGRVYANASYPFSPIDRASAIASIATGVTPYYNNITGKLWLNRKTLRPVFCVDDSAFPGLLTDDTSSAAALCTSTIGDELKVVTGGKAHVFSIAPYRDAAILAAGHAANAATWIDDIRGNWCSTSYYSSSLPAWIGAYNSMHPADSRTDNTTWEPCDMKVGNLSYFMYGNDSRSFKHRFSGPERYTLYKTSGLVNKDVTDMAQQCVYANGMGNDAVTDLLSLTYYAGTFDHRTVTECQTELEDTYVRLDNEIARLMDYLDEHIGKDRVLYVLTSTGYSDIESTDYQKYRIPSGVFQMDRTSNLLNMYLGAIWGQGIYIESTFGNQIFLNHKLLENKKVSITDATNRAQEILVMMSGVRNVYTSLQLITSQNQQLQKIRNGFSPEHSGDLFIEVAPGWQILDENGQQVELSRASFTPFPIIFYGNGIESERIQVPVTTDRIAPTIARCIRIRAPNACSSEPLF